MLKLLSVPCNYLLIPKLPRAGLILDAAQHPNKQTDAPSSGFTWRAIRANADHYDVTPTALYLVLGNVGGKKTRTYK